jgi:RHS repeat-associated protein
MPNIGQFLKGRLSDKSSRPKSRKRIAKLPTISPTAVAGRNVLNVLLVSILSLNILGTGLPALIASYNDAQGRIPHALTPSENKYTPAADALNSGGKLAKLPDSVNAQLAEDLAKARKGKQDLTHVKTLDEGRTANEKVYLNADGSKSFEHSFQATSFKDSDGKWQDVDASLVEDKGNGKWHTKANAWQVSFGDISEGIRITNDGQTFSFTPVDGKSVKPQVTGDAPNQVVTYRNVWQGIDLQYSVSGSELKESIIVKSKAAQTDFSFNTNGASLTKSADGSMSLDGAFTGFIIAAPSVTTATDDKPNTKVVTQDFKNGQLTISLDGAWLDALPVAAFPVVIDPTVIANIGNSYSNFSTINPNAPACTGVACAGQTVGVDSSGNTWRFAYQTSFTVPTLGYLTSAKLHLELLSGDTASRTISVDHSTCQTSINNCDSGDWGMSTGTIATNSSPNDIDVTTVYKNAINNGTGSFSPWMMVAGDESGSAVTYKMFDATKTKVTLTFDTLPSGFGVGSTTGSPADGGVSVTTQPTFFVDPATVVDGDGPGPNQYRFVIGTSKNVPPSNPLGLLPSVGGVLADSGRLQLNQWTVPDSVLQDGQTYYWQPLAWDFTTGVPDVYGPVYSFKVDLRNGKDATQAFDAVGPVSTDLATGNLTSSTKSHSIAALGGSMGVNLDYNSPQRSSQGLVGQYWNFTGTTPPTFPGSGVAPNLTRTDPNINFNWGSTSPYAGLITPDNFMVRWTGYFVAPQTGTYQFGANSDNGVKIYVGGNLNLDSWNANPVNAFGTGVALTAGQVIALKYEYYEGSGNASAQFLVKTTDNSITQQVIPATWLQTGARSIATPHGLVGRYYTDDGSHNFPAQDDPTRLFLSRTDPSLSLDWGGGSPVPGGPADNFMVRWTGFFTAPVADTYKFGAGSDDGVKIYLDNNPTPTVNAWSDHGSSPIVYASSGVAMTAGQTKQITVEYYEHGGAASMGLYMRQAGVLNGTLDIPVPSSALSTQAQVLPDGWNIGIDADGNLSYDYAYISAGSVILLDSTGQTHEYKYNGTSTINGGFTPPVGEDGHMVRNSNGTVTFQDSDGRTYIFNPDGSIKSSTTSSDDRNPAALQYIYGSSNGGPAHLTQISDAVTQSNPDDASTATRWAKVLYSGDSGCPTPPGGFLGAPSGMICAVTTSDSQITKFFYIQTAGHYRLARLELPGGEITDYGYLTEDPNSPTSCPGCLASSRDSLANDAIAAGQRTSTDTTIQTDVTYDALGKVSGITMPAATVGATHMGRTYNYYPASTNTLVHATGATEPSGYTRKVVYDATYRTTDDYDVAGLDTKTQWHATKDLILSTTDPAGLMSTTRYDYADRPTDQYGPAPSTWFDTANPATSLTYGLPLTTPTDYTPQVPHTQTGYDQTVNGLAAAYYDVDSFANGTGTTAKALFGNPKLHATGVGPSNGDVVKTWGTSQPITPSQNTYGWGLRLSGDIHFTANGAQNFTVKADDGVRLWIDDTLVLDDWSPANMTYHDRVATPFNNTSGDSWHRIRLDYYNKAAGATLDTDAHLELWLNGSSALGSLLKPHYGLVTTQKTFDSSTSVGDVAATTDYGTNPELGLAQSNNLDPTGLNYTSTSTYEAQGAPGSFLRQTSKSLPGAASGSPSTSFTHYGANETRQNPCDTSQIINQAGMVKLKTEADPDLTGPLTGRTTETVYDAAGRIIATRVGTDSWTCTTYDSRGRILSVNTPANSVGATAIVVKNNWARGGNPLITSSGQSSTGTSDDDIRTTVDLLGRTVSYYAYVQGAPATTTSTYDNLGRLSSRSGPVGTETFTYDNYGRLTGQLLDGTTYAVPSYDAYGRLSQVTYPAAGQLKLVIGRDTLGRTVSNTYTLGNGTAGPVDTVTRSQSGQITSGTELGQAKSYGYDKAGRLTSASIFGNTYAYNFGTPTSCTGTYNANAGKNGNRTSQTINGVTTTFCYDYADRLISSSDPTLTDVEYDSHGNITELGNFYNTSNLQFAYDAIDRTTLVRQYSGGPVGIQYYRDVQGRITYRSDRGTSVPASDTYFGYTGPGDTPDFLVDTHAAIIEKYVQLPGGVVLTKRSSTAAYSLPNVHGDIFATTDQTGNSLATFKYDPFGARIGTAQPANVTGGESLGWVGSNDKIAEYQFTNAAIQLGARTYIPAIGRFMSVDPQEGGNENSYVYPPDPVNDFDLDGNAGWFGKIVSTVTRVASIGSNLPGPVGVAFSAVAVAGNVAQGHYKEALIASAGLLGIGIAGKVAARIMTSRGMIRLGARLMDSRRIGVISRYLGNNTIMSPRGYQKFAPGKWNNKQFIRFGWSVAPTRIGYRPTLRLSLGRGQGAFHMDVIYGRFR